MNNSNIFLFNAGMHILATAIWASIPNASRYFAIVFFMAAIYNLQAWNSRKAKSK